jgi:hypothetical protein
MQFTVMTIIPAKAGMMVVCLFSTPSHAGRISEEAFLDDLPMTDSRLA